MGDKSGIAWTNATWNPLAGCTRVSKGCDNCYAFALHDRRYALNLKAGVKHAITMQQGVLVKPQEARKQGVTLPFPAQYDLPFSRLQLLPDRLDQPLRWRKPRRVFVNSMSDLFHEDVPWHFIDEVFAVMALAGEHTFQVLTKRPQIMRSYMDDARPAKIAVAAQHLKWQGKHNADSFPLAWPLPNVWLGVSVEDQAAADLRIPPLLQTPAAVRFISAEPLLGPINLSACGTETVAEAVQRKAKLDWVIVGGESGPRHRPLDLAWAHSIREQCRAANVAYFGKQTSGARSGIALPDEGGLSDREWPS